MSISDINPLRLFVSKLVRHSALSVEEKQALLALPAHPVQVSYNSDFVRLGERVEYACLVVDGLVGRFGQNRDGSRQITALHIPGDMPDLHSMISPIASSALQALTVTTIMKVPHSALRGLVREHPNVAEAFWRECVADAAVLSEWVVNVGRRDARTRIAHFLCELACRYEATGTNVGFEFDLPVTQDQLADITALTPVHVNRMLKVLQEQNIAMVRNRRVTVLDWQKLVATGEFNSDYLQITKSQIAESEAA